MTVVSVVSAVICDELLTETALLIFLTYVVFSIYFLVGFADQQIISVLKQSNAS
jgi:hypothetical protein